MTEAITDIETRSDQKLQKYWTPDGREVLSAPNYHEYFNKEFKTGGTRDANLDKGWLLSPPVKPKMYCPHCDRWHDTKAQVDKCGEKRRKTQTKFQAWAEKKMQKESGGNDKELAKLKTELSDLKQMLAELLRKEGKPVRKRKEVVT